MVTQIESNDSEGLESIQGLTYEQAFSELEATVAALESDAGSLEEALALFERGQALARHCSGLLDQAELKIKRLSGGELEDFTPQP
jgi:exodeoxyribonuclease VII small subunit